MADVYMNIVEYTKTLADPLKQGLIETFAAESDILRTIGFKAAPQGKYAYDREAALPSIGFRAINEDPEISHGVFTEQVDHCYPMSGLLNYDRIKLMRYGEGRRAQEMRLQMKAAAAEWTDTFMEGDNNTQPREFSGMKARLSGAAVVANATKDNRILINNNSSGGGALSMTNLDIAIELTRKPTHLLMNPRIKTRFIQYARTSSLSGFITQDKDNMGMPITRYNGLPILTGYEPTDFHAGILPFSEVGAGGGSAVTTSIYVLSLNDEGVSGIQTAPIDVIDVGHTDKGTNHRDLVEWDSGVVMEHPYAAIRLSSVTDAAIVA